MFSLRRVEAKDLVAQAGAGLPKTGKTSARGKVLDDALLADVFGIELDEVVPPVEVASPRRTVATKKTVVKKAAAKKPAAKPVVATTAMTAESKKAVRAKKPAPAIAAVTPRKPAAGSTKTKTKSKPIK